VGARSSGSSSTTMRSSCGSSPRTLRKRSRNRVLDHCDLASLWCVRYWTARRRRVVDRDGADAHEAEGGCRTWKSRHCASSSRRGRRGAARDARARPPPWRRGRRTPATSTRPSHPSGRLVFHLIAGSSGRVATRRRKIFGNRQPFDGLVDRVRHGRKGIPRLPLVLAAHPAQSASRPARIVSLSREIRDGPSARAARAGRG